MVVLGIILLLVAAALVLLLATAGTSQDIVLDLVGGQQLTTSPIWVFVAGAVTLALAEIGVWLISRGTRRAVARRREMRDLRQAAAVPTDREGVRRSDDRPADDERLPSDQSPESDRLLVRDVDELRAREGLEPATGPTRSPESTVDPEAGRHKVRLDGLEERERRH